MPPIDVASIDDLQKRLERQLYVADRGLATSIYLALKLRRPLLLEGEAGVGKTEVARVLAMVFGAELCVKNALLWSAMLYQRWRKVLRSRFPRAGFKQP